MNNATKTKTNEQILVEASEAAEGAVMRAANRGWDWQEQARCGKEAAEAVLADYGFTQMSDLY